VAAVVGVADVSDGAPDAGADKALDDEATDGVSPAGNVLPVPADGLPDALAEASTALLCGLEQAAMVTATNPNAASVTGRLGRDEPGRHEPCRHEPGRWRPPPLRETCTVLIVTRQG
jgi:hypothetical protein